MKAESVLLEPYYEFRLEIPADCVGRAMTDVEGMHGIIKPPVIEGEQAVLTGTAPVVTMQDYRREVSAYTRGRGNLFCSLMGYAPCHNAKEVIERLHYQPEEDLENPASSVFCSHGAGFIVPWDQVEEYMHVESILESDARTGKDMQEGTLSEKREFDYSIDEEQIAEILKRTYHANEKASKHYRKPAAPAAPVSYKSKAKPKPRQKYLIVDGYNIVHAWDELSVLLEDNIDGARMKLMDILCNYQAFVKCELIVVFDAYKVKGNLGEMFDYHNIHVVYTKEAETADSYIEKLTHQISKDYQVTVATSDGLIQLITRGQNCAVLSARELKEEVNRVEEAIREYLHQ